MSVDGLVLTTSTVEWRERTPEHTLTILRFRKPDGREVVTEFWKCACGEWSSWLDVDPVLMMKKRRPIWKAARVGWNTHRREPASER